MDNNPVLVDGQKVPHTAKETSKWSKTLRDKTRCQMSYSRQLCLQKHCHAFKPI